MSLPEALDLDTDGLGTQAARLRLVQPSAALITAAGLMRGGLPGLAGGAGPGGAAVERDSLPSSPANWGTGARSVRPSGSRRAWSASLAADDYHQVTLQNGGRAPRM
jgi:hypothetical protein